MEGVCTHACMHACRYMCVCMHVGMCVRVYVYKHMQCESQRSASGGIAWVPSTLFFETSYFIGLKHSNSP